MKKKKKKKAIARRRAQAKAKKHRRAKSRASDLIIQQLERPPLSKIEAPPGFLAIPMTQALMEYAEPLMNLVEEGVVDDPNDAFQIAAQLWNYGISAKNRTREAEKKKIVKQIEKTLKLSPEESREFFEKMIERKEHLFPQSIQPKDPMTMFMRKEKHYSISGFDYDSLKISKKRYSPNEEDVYLINLINQLDEYILHGATYDDWEDLYLMIEERFRDPFEHWLDFKGLSEYSEDFSFFAETYFRFVYGYLHYDNITLKTITPIYIEEFFMDHLLRKAHAKPGDYVLWMPAVKLFYQFLLEMNYLEKPKKIIKMLDEIEPRFIEMLRERYS